MIPIYDNEAYEIVETINRVQTKYIGKTNTDENLQMLENEIIGKLQDMGFRAIVDVTPCFLDPPLPIEVRVEERIDKKHDFDHDLKRYEVNKAHELSKQIYVPNFKTKTKLTRKQK